MFGSLLIGFEYSGKKKLPGTLVDLFVARKFLKEKSKIEDFLILTDIEDFNINFIDSLGKVNSEIFSFYPTGKEKNVHTLDSFLEEVSEYSKKVKYLCIYYSGHCLNNKMDLGSEYLDFSVLEDFIFRVNTNIELCFILDCCDFKNNLKSFCVSSNLEKPISTNTGSLFTKEFFGCLDISSKKDLPEWILGQRLRLCKIHGFYLIFNLEKINYSTKEYLS